jgi:spermidine synthase
MTEENWQHIHLAALARRLSWLSSQPDGVIHDLVSELHRIRLIKHVGQIHFYFLDPSSGALDGPMSRLEIERPLRLLAEYSQAAMLSLLWKPDPKRVCLLGLAGGRLSLIFYHYFPHVIIDNVDIDPAVIAIATSYFGLTFDRRQTITIQDARAILNTGPADRSYDIVVMDAFCDDTDNLNHLATTQFYAECKPRLAIGGVLCANILRSDPLFYEKVKTFLESFRHVFVSEHKHGIVLFGNDYSQLTSNDLIHKALMLQQKHGFEFPFAERAAALQAARTNAPYSRRSLRDVGTLSDE